MDPPGKGARRTLPRVGCTERVLISFLGDWWGTRQERRVPHPDGAR